MADNPQVLAWLMCDGVHIDPSTGKHFILGCFSNIRVRQFPAAHPRMFWFLSLAEVPTGDHKLKISFGPSYDRLRTIVEREIKSQSPMQKINIINEIKNLPFEQEGEHLIQIEVDEEPLLVTSLHVAGPGPQQLPPQR